jgi:hypothetical protein
MVDGWAVVETCDRRLDVLKNQANVLLLEWRSG